MVGGPALRAEPIRAERVRSLGSSISAQVPCVPTKRQAGFALVIGDGCARRNVVTGACCVQSFDRQAPRRSIFPLMPRLLWWHVRTWLRRRAGNGERFSNRVGQLGVSS